MPSRKVHGIVWVFMNFLFSLSVLQWSCKEDSRGRGKSGDPHPSRNWYWHYWYRNKSRLSCEGTCIENIIIIYLKSDEDSSLSCIGIISLVYPWNLEWWEVLKSGFVDWFLSLEFTWTIGWKYLNALHELVTQVIFCSYLYLSVACVASKLKNIFNFILLK